jgi:hypothetical protein
MKSVLNSIIISIVLGAPLTAQPQASRSGSAPSLAELARRLRAERKAQPSKALKVFTNDNIPHRGGISVVGAVPPAAPPAEGRSAGLRPRKENRSKAARDAFLRENPCPSTGKSHGDCSGYVVDHIVPLACGGADAPFNMQWQTRAEGKAKWELKACGR